MEEARVRSGTVRLLGPTVVEDATGAARPSTSPLLRTLLALLASRPGEVVGTGTLIDELWGDSGPRDPRSALQVQATRLRAWLGEAGLARAALRHEHGGYVLGIDPQHVDLVRFAAAAGAADRAGPGADAVAHCDAALAEWRDEPFGGCVVGLVLEAEQVRFRELRLRTIERRAEALLAMGRPDDAVVELTVHRRRHPARERLTELTMVGLYRAGRQQEALAAFAEARRALAELHGLPPGAALVRAEAAILAGDPALLAVPAPAPVRTTPVRARPLIIGRDDELGVVADRLADRSRGALVVVTGEAGAGKTTLAAAVAHDVMAAGGDVGWGRSAEAAPLEGWREALADLAVDAGALAAEQRVRAVRAALSSRGRAAPVLVVLEDVHTADAASLGLLAGLVQLEVPAGVVVLVTARDPDVDPHPTWSAAAADLARAAAAVLVPLGPLPRHHADALVARRLPDLAAADRDEVAEELWRASAGHALHLTALLDLLADHRAGPGALAEARGIPPRLRPLLAHQLGSLPEDARDVVDALAVTGPVAADAVAALLDLDVLAVTRALRPALHRGLAVDDGTTVGLRHDLWAAAVRDAMGPTTAEELHLRRLAQLAGGDPFERLRHATGAGARLPVAERAGIRLAAGRAAFARGAHAEAADHLAVAAAEAEEAGSAVVAARLHHGLALAALGRVEEADELLDAVVADPTATVEELVDAAVGHELLGFRVVGDARRLRRLDHALAHAGEVDVARRVEVLRALLIEESLVHDRPPSAAARAELEELLASAPDALDATQWARQRSMQARESVEQPIPAAERLARTRAAHDAAVAADDPILVLESLELLVSALLAAGAVDEVHDVRWELDRLAEGAGRPRSTWAARLLPAALALARGERKEADALAAAALDHGLALGIPDALGAFGVHLVTGHVLDGRLGEQAALIDSAVAQYPAIAAWPAAAALAAVQGGDPAGAHGHLEAYLAKRSAQASRYFDRPGLAMAATAAWLAGDAPVTRRVAEVVVDDLPRDADAVVVVGVGAATLGPVDLYVAMARAALDATDDALDALATASALAGRLGWGPWARCAEVLASQVSTAGSDRTPPPVPGPNPAIAPLGLRHLP